MKQIALHGAYTTNNFGDVLLGRLFAGWIREAGADSLALTFPSEANKVALGGDAFGWEGLASSKGLIFGGGGYFGEPPKSKWRWAVRNFRLHATVGLRAQKLGIPTAIVGVGAGPIAAPFLRLAVGRIARKSEVVLVRDEESAAFMRSIGVSQVRVGADAVLTMEPLPMPSTPPVVVLHLQAPKGHETGQRAVGEALAEFLTRNPDWTAQIVSDGGRIRLGAEAMYESDRVANDLIARFPARVQAVPYENEPNRLIETLAAARCVVTTKLHVGIVAAALGRSVLSFPHHTKTERLFRQLEATARCVPLDSVSTDGAGRMLEGFAEAPMVVPASVRELAGRNVAAIREFVGNR